MIATEINQYMSLDYFITKMPKSRPADYHIAYHDCSVFIDFNNCDDGKICLVKISFDGYGCCGLGNNAKPLSKKDSEIFKEIVSHKVLDQKKIHEIVKKAISANKKLIWMDALKEYELI